MPSVLLVSLPWTTLIEPSLGLGLLQAVLDREGIPCRVLHLNLFLLQHLKATTYQALTNVWALNDFLFSGILDPALTHAQERALRQIVWGLPRIGLHEAGGAEGVAATVLRLRHEVIPAWLEGWADEIAQHEASLIGFTCMFDQTISSLALAKMVRQRAPDKMLVLGGYAVRSPTAQTILRSSPWIDAICDGEGEAVIGKLARAAAGEVGLHAVPGIVFRTASGEPASTPPPPPADLNANPVPNFDDFFADIRRLSQEHMVDVTPLALPIEPSRGCWWGTKHHCIFCGIRDEDMDYRALDAGRVLETMAEIHRRYRIGLFRFSGYILPHRYFDTLLPELVRLGRPYVLSAELKANLTEERFALLAQAGFLEVQAGIESFSSDVLRKMDKGVTAIQNVHTLVMGRRHNVHVLYNLLFGFPDDDEAEYARMAGLLPRLKHLDPPLTCVPVQVTRWAPLQARPEAFGIERAHAGQAYDVVFSQQYMERTGFDVDDYCYYYERTFENSGRLQKLYEQIDEIVAVWRAPGKPNQAWLYQDGPGDSDGITVRDRRGPEETVHRLDAPTAGVLHACTRPVSLRELCEAGLPGVTPDTVENVVGALDALGLIFREGPRLVSLVLPGPPAGMEAESPDRVEQAVPASTDDRPFRDGALVDL